MAADRPPLQVPDQQPGWSPIERELNSAAHAHSQHMVKAQAAGAELRRLVHQAVDQHGLGSSAIARVTGLDELLVREILLDR